MVFGGISMTFQWFSDFLEVLVVFLSKHVTFGRMRRPW